MPNCCLLLWYLTATNNTFGNTVIDFWTGFPVANKNGMLPQYDAGDGIHMNDAAHQILFDRVIGKDIHTTIKNSVLSVSDISTASKDISVYPNPVKDDFFVSLKTVNQNHFRLKFIV